MDGLACFVFSSHTVSVVSVVPNVGGVCWLFEEEKSSLLCRRHHYFIILILILIVIIDIDIVIVDFVKEE